VLHHLFRVWYNNLVFCDGRPMVPPLSFSNQNGCLDFFCYLFDKSLFLFSFSKPLRPCASFLDVILRRCLPCSLFSTSGCPAAPVPPNLRVPPSLERKDYVERPPQNSFYATERSDGLLFFCRRRNLSPPLYLPFTHSRDNTTLKASFFRQHNLLPCAVIPGS